MKIVTGVGENAHVTSKEFRRIIESVAGQGSYIIKCADNMKTEIISNNLLKIKGGAMIHHGNISSVDPYDEIEINNGTQGMKRIDLVVNRYVKDVGTEIERSEWVLIQGVPAASNPEVPAHIIGNLQEDDLIDDCPFCQIIIDGINITEVRELLGVIPSITELNEEVAELKGNMEFKNIASMCVVPDTSATVNCKASANEVIMSYAGGNVEHYEGQALVNLPKAYRPNTNRYFVGMNGLTPTVFRLDTDGDISIWSASSYSAGRIYFECSIAI